MICKWVNLDDKLMVKYHNEEWGKKTLDDKILFEFIVLESFQAGLSWSTIINKRENFRKSFDNFDYNKISEYDEEKINSLMNNKGIIRNKLKILATINNAKCFIKIKKEYGSFSNYIWKFSDVINNTTDIFPVRNELSDIISKDMKKKGFKFFGTVICYSYLQAIGIINDHETKCIYKLDGVR